MRKLTITFSIGLFLILLGSITAANTVAAPESPNYAGNRNTEATWIRTPQIVVRLDSTKPNIMFWDSSQNDSTGVYNVWIHSVAELFGDDLVLDSRAELNGQFYNLIFIDWTSEIVQTETELTVSLISEELSNGAVIKFIFHAYFADGTVDETQIASDDSTTVVTHDVKTLSEVKFDIVVENWTFSEGAQALTLGVRVNELKNRHRIRVNESTLRPDGATINRTRIGFGTEDVETAYINWVPTYNVYDAEGVLESTKNVTVAAASYGLAGDQGPSAGQRFGIEYANIFFLYENYGDGKTMIHDPTIGVSSDTIDEESVVPAFELGIVITATLGLVMITRRRK
ncbi:MAG: hypothetical protein ACTSYA_02190 [Candidatus Kariarchaeaceae archaeon]